MPKERVDIDAPIAWLVDRSGMTLRELGDAMGTTHVNVIRAKQRGQSVELATILKFAAACGYDLEIVAVPRK